eukprot:CAMPEP_0119434230 /NCGR_PEP_ID=MMETSP1335-20130426/50562_1 /TAXON_ID=259385 /ORGANISM="Chrysoculter rhomboideus, Strain RCC1486" /LENGTH=94 /DNA_ID=CAMNT_0007460085 /DNA_START=166 /DNA_END=450 /DNA_ORIENTATION=-
MTMPVAAAATVAASAATVSILAAMKPRLVHCTMGASKMGHNPGTKMSTAPAVVVAQQSNAELVSMSSAETTVKNLPPREMNFMKSILHNNCILL